MRIAGIICEYNPFHMGHKHQIDTLRSMGYECIVCVMSGNYTQRGELAIFDKYTRAKAAVACGADLVVELPFPYSSLSAEEFANAGVRILASLGADTVSFGSECGDLHTLENAARTILSPDFKQKYSELQRGKLGSAAAYFEAIKYFSGEGPELLSNDILGISYLAAIQKMGLDIKVVPIKREGANYNDKTLFEGVLPSASAIREALNGSEDNIGNILDGFVPDPVVHILEDATIRGIAPISLRNIGTEILSFFRLMTAKEIINRAILRCGGGEYIAEDGCGICERVCNTARSSDNFEKFMKACYSSKYTNARINRVILFSVLGVSNALTHKPPEYTTLLAASSAGREILSVARKKCEFEIVTKPADAPRDSVQRKIGEAADILYSSAFPTYFSCDFFIKSRPFVMK
ncbi:MAG: nucleotidyltransferase family protein [Oscillospiraceae bacterium]|nr:nucleotidyltransferase family protein [Oscillospiraceae bacterium]